MLMPVHHTYCLHPRFYWHLLHLPLEGWPGWVDRCNIVVVGNRIKMLFAAVVTLGHSGNGILQNLCFWLMVKYTHLILTRPLLAGISQYRFSLLISITRYITYVVSLFWCPGADFAESIVMGHVSEYSYDFVVGISGTMGKNILLYFNCLHNAESVDFWCFYLMRYLRLS